MKMQKCRILALILVLVMLFSGCEPFLPQYANVDPIMGHEIIPYESMEYTRPDIEAIQKVFERAMESTLREDAFGAVEQAIIECINVYNSFYTQYNLSYIKYCGDVTDTYWQEEYNFCVSQAVAVDQFLNELYCALADSDYRAQLETEEYFGEGFFTFYEDDTFIDDEYVALMEREAELLERYYALVEESSASTYYEDAYYDAYANRYMELYIDIIKLRQEIAAYVGYDSYLEYSYVNEYYRDYSPKDVEKYLEEIGTTFKDDYAALCNMNIWKLVSNYCSEAATLEYLKQSTDAMGELYQYGYNALAEGKLYDITYNQNKYDISYEVYLPDYAQPFIFMCPYSYQGDKLTFAHEFGHFMNDYVCGGSGAGIDVAEIHSQAFEYLSLCYVEDVDNLVKYKMANSLCTYVETGVYALFEHKAYQLSEEELTVDNLFALYEEIATEFGFDARAWDKREIINVPHIFIYPLYMISYVVSNDLAMQFYQLELEEEGKGLALYEECLYSQDTFIIEFAENYGLESPFKEGRLEKVKETFEEVLN